MMRHTSTGNAAEAVVGLAREPNHHSGGGGGGGGGSSSSRGRTLTGHRSIRVAMTLALTVALTLQPVGCSVETSSERQQNSETTTMTNSNYTTEQASETDTTNAHTSNLSSAVGGGQTKLASDGESVKFPLYMRLIATFVCLIIFTVGVCGNLLVPLVVIKTKYLRNSTNLFLINLSIADLLVLIFCMPTMLIELHSRPETWLLGETMCKLGNFIEMLAANSSIFTILAISFERYYAICKPLKAGYKCTRLRASIIIGIIWLLSCILTSPILNMAKSDETIYIDGSVVRNCILETATYWNRMYVFVSMIAFFCLPLLVLMLVYWLIGRRLIRENVSMMDATRDNLIENRSHKRQPNDIYDTSISSSSYVSSVFRKRFTAKSRRSFRSLFKLSHLHGEAHALANDRKSASGQSKSIDLGTNIKGTDPIRMTQERSLKGTVLGHISSSSRIKRENMKGAKTLSLDNYGNHQRNQSSQLNQSPERVIQSPSRGQSESQSFWSSIVTQTGHDIRAQPSSCETTTATATTSSSPPSRGTTGAEAGKIPVSYLSRLKFDLRSLRNLLGGINRSSNPITISNGIDHLTIHTSNVQDGGIKSRPKDGTNTTTDCHKPQLSHESKITDGLRLTTGSNYEGGTIKSDEGLKSVKRIHQLRTESKLVSVSDYHRGGRKKRSSTTDSAPKSNKRESNGAKDSKRISSSLKRPNEERESSSFKFRFKWIKGVSISSSTGSTRTNSTCLASDTGSIYYRNQNTPSPPRSVPFQQQQQQYPAREQGNGIKELVCEQNVCPPINRDTSSEKLVPVIEHRETPTDETCGHSRGKNWSIDANTIRSTRRALLDSRSSSIIYNEAEISSYTEGSSSPTCSIAADFTSTRSWIESLSLQDQRNTNDANQFRGHLRRLSEHEGNQHFVDDLIRSTKLESVHELSSIYTETKNGAQVLEVVDEDENNLNADKEPNEQLNGSWRTHSKVGATISFSDTAPGTNTDFNDEKALGLDSIDKRFNHGLTLRSQGHVENSSCDLIVSENSGHSGEANLVAIANCPNGIENLRGNVAGKRSGSHPVVSCHKLAKHIDGPVEVHCLQPEYIAVRDVSKKQQMDSRRQVVAMLAFVVACFFLLFFPYRVFTIWLIMSTEDQVQSLGMETYYNITYFSRILIYLHSAINPIAYNLISTKFRRAFTSILLCRGASTRRNFNVEHRYVYKPKNQTYNQARPKITDCSSNKSPIALRGPA